MCSNVNNKVLFPLRNLLSKFKKKLEFQIGWCLCSLYFTSFTISKILFPIDNLSSELWQPAGEEDNREIKCENQNEIMAGVSLSLSPFSVVRGLLPLGYHRKLMHNRKRGTGRALPNDSNGSTTAVPHLNRHTDLFCLTGISPPQKKITFASGL